MDFAKYVSILNDGGLWFARSDELGDPFEGSVSRMTLEQECALFALVYNEIEGISKEQIEQAVDSHAKRSTSMRQNMRQWIYVSTWHMNKGESAAMWGSYAKTNEAVAIQSTYERLRECLPSQVDTSDQPVQLGSTASNDSSIGPRLPGNPYYVYLGKVQYVDYASEEIPTNPIYFPFLHKMESFRHEQEVRAVFHSQPIFENPKGGIYPPWEMTNMEKGRLVKLPIENLIEAVYVHPFSQSWFYELVKAVTKKYELGKPVKRSLMGEKPLF